MVFLLALLFPTSAFAVMLDIPARKQWNGNYGYCGEVALISAGLYYGQYVSQYDIRELASPGMPQYEEKSQLLLGDNDRATLKAMHLSYESFDTSANTSPASFLSWVKSRVLRGYPVAIGIFMNERLFYGKEDPDAGNSGYDHIVPVIGVEEGDVLVFSDSGLWVDDDDEIPYVFRYPFATFPADRETANTGDAVYSLSDKPREDYGIAVTGVADRDRETLPVRVATDRNDERPIRDGSNLRPKAVSVKLTVTVSGLEPGVPYKLYRYDDFADVPEAAFNQHSGQATRTWDISIREGTTYTLTEKIKSNETVIYRAVRATAH
jgi:hypothetical protein